MGTRLENIVLEIHLMQQDTTLGVALGCEFAESRKVPWIKRLQVIFAQPIPSQSLTAPSPRLFVERSPYLTVHTSDHFMVIPATVVPKPPVMFKNRLIVLNHRIGELIEVVRETLACSPRRKSGHSNAELGDARWQHRSSPPHRSNTIASSELIAYAKPSVSNREQLWLNR